MMRSQKSYVSYVDDRFPSSTMEPVIRHKHYLLWVIVSLLQSQYLGATWAHNEPVSKEHFSYTDQNGQYAFGNLDPGMWYVNVFMEDISLQESTFRPHSDPTILPRFYMFLGFLNLPLKLTMWVEECSCYGSKSRELGRPKDPYQNEFTEEFYNKTLEGMAEALIIRRPS